jgi:tetratricopeptide (TPR) repeat protein
LLAGEWKGFTEQEKKRESALEDSLKAVPATRDEKTAIIKGRIIKELVIFNDSASKPVHALYYSESMAELLNNTQKWCNLGERYYKYALVTDSLKSPVMLKKAQDCYEKAIKLDSANLNARVGLGQCIVESGDSPMRGIGMIEDVLKKDSNNENAYIALGVFSIKSGQFPKAVNRFNKVLQLDPSFGEGYLYLAQAYEGLGNLKLAIVNLKKYSIFAPDSIVKSEVNRYIEELQKNEK